MSQNEVPAPPVEPSRGVPGLALKAALDFPKEVRGAVTVAALITEPRPYVQPFVDLAGHPFVSPLVPRTLHHSRAEVAGRRAQIGPLFERLVAAYDGRLPGRSVAWYAGDGDRLRLAAAVEEHGEAPPGVETETLPAVARAVVTTYRGPISGIGDAWQALGAHLAEHGHQPAGICREIYHEIHLDGAHDEVIELQQPVA